MHDMGRIALECRDAVQHALGFVANVDQHHRVSFRHPELGMFLVLLTPEDPEHFTLAFPAFIDARHAPSPDHMLRACNAMNLRARGVKFVMNDAADGQGEVTAAADMAVPYMNGLPHRELLQGSLHRSFGLLTVAVRAAALRLRQEFAAGSNSTRGTPAGVH
jgi:hypothetical protein